MINANILTINEITSNVSKYIQEAIDNTEKSKISVPLGSFMGVQFLSGEGPNINIDIASVGNIDTELRSEFIAQGINQTLHRIYLQVDCEVAILIPFETLSQEISNQVLLIENVIIGQIPDNYYNFEGIQDQTETLEVID